MPLRCEYRSGILYGSSKCLSENKWSRGRIYISDRHFIVAIHIGFKLLVSILAKCLRFLKCLSETNIKNTYKKRISLNIDAFFYYLRKAKSFSDRHSATFATITATTAFAAIVLKLLLAHHRCIRIVAALADNVVVVIRQAGH